MFGGLRKKLNEVWSGLDFYDTKENQQQRQQFAKAAPVRTVSQPKQVAPVTTQRRIDDSFGTGFSGLKNKLADKLQIDGADTKADRIRRFATTGLDESYDQEQARKTKEANNRDAYLNTREQGTKSVVGGFGDAIAKTPGALAQLQGRTIKAFDRIDNPVLRTGAKLITPGGASMLFQNSEDGDKQLKRGQDAQKLVENKRQQSSWGDRKDDNKTVTGVGNMAGNLAFQLASGVPGLVATGSQFAAEEANKAEAAGKSNEYALTTGLIQGGASALSEKFGIDKFLPGKSDIGGKLTTNLVKNVGKRFVTEGAQEAQQQFTSNLIANKLYNPNQGLTEGVAQSAVMGGIAGGAMSPLVDLSIPRTPSNPQVQTPRNARQGEYNILSDYQDTLYGNIPSGAVVNQIHKDARQVADRLGIDIVTGSPAEISNRINEVLSRPPQAQSLPDAKATVPGLTTRLVKPKKPLFKPLNEGGYIQVPGGKNTKLNDTELGVINYLNNKPNIEGDATRSEGNAIPSDQPTSRRQELLDRMKKLTKPMNEGGYAKNPFYDKKNVATEGLSEQQSEFINGYAEMIKDQGEGNGVDVNPETGTRITNNSRSAETKGKKMSQYDWFNEAKRQIESGQAMYGASEDYKALPSAEPKSTPKTVEAKDTRKADRWTTPLPDTGKTPVPKKLDTNGVQVKEGDKIEFYGASPDGKKGTATIRWEGPYRANASGKEFDGQWLGNGTLDNNIPFKIIERDGKPFTEPKTQKKTNLVLGEKTLPDGSRIQKVRVGRGKIEERTVEAPKKQGTLTAKQYADTFGESESQAIQELAEPTNTAATQNARSKETKKLLESISQDDIITKATREAQINGEELNFFAKKDANGRSVGIERFDPSYHRIEAGFVTDKHGNVLGNHIKVDETGMMINVGGDVVNIETITGNPLDWAGHYKMNSTMERNIYDNAPNKEVADKTYKFVIAHKIKNEANLKTELKQQRTDLNTRTKAVMKAKPFGKSKKAYREDVFDFIEGNMKYGELASKYGNNTAKVIQDYKNQTRTLYDTLLDRANTVFGKFGEPQVEKRQDYITHINELMGKPSFAGELYGQLQNTFMGEGNQTTRGGVPGSISGRTENFEPRKKWNRFFQQRKGGEFTKDPFKAVDAYLEPTLYNIHMTESAVRARAVEAAFRTASELKNTDTSAVKDTLKDELLKYKESKENAKLVTGFQEYANALAGKTQRFDRQVIDSSDAAAQGMRAWQGLQRIGGQSTILGNVSSVFAQTLNQPGTVADAGVINYVKGISRSLGGDKTIEQSPFIKARRTKVDSKFRSKYQKTKDLGGVPLQLVEMAMVEQTWNAEYSKVQSEGLKGQEAIIEADRRTERVVAGRGIADKPELYRSTLANGVLQYTLEVSAQNKKFFQDYTPVQKAKFIGATFAMNSLMGAITGFEPLPDYLDAAIESIKDFMDEDDDRSAVQKGINAGQRFLGETASMSPVTTAVANTMLDQNQRKKLFGSESSLGMFEGTSAPINVVKKGFNAVSSAASGDYGKALENATGVIPFGNQIKKTAKGIQLLATGKATDSYGNEIYNAPESLAGKAQALAFGPNATSGAKKFYAMKDEGLTTDQIEQLRDAEPGKAEEWKKMFLDRNAKKKTDDKSGGSTSSKIKEVEMATEERNDKLKGTLSPDDWAIHNMSKAEKAQLVKDGYKTEADLKGLDNYIENKKKELGFPAKDKSFYEKTYTERYETVKQELATEDLSAAQRIRKEKQLNKLNVQKKYADEVNELYSLSKNDIYNYVTSDKNGKKTAEQLIALDKALYDAKLIRYRKFKNGLITGTASGGSGGGRGGKKGSKYDWTKDLFASDGSKTTKALRKILEDAMRG